MIYLATVKGHDWLTFVVRAPSEAEAETLVKPAAEVYLIDEYEGADYRQLAVEGPPEILVETVG